MKAQQLDHHHVLIDNFFIHGIIDNPKYDKNLHNNHYYNYYLEKH